MSREKFDFRLDLAVKAGTGKACTIVNMQTKIESGNMIPASFREFYQMNKKEIGRSLKDIEGS